ncbi:Acyl-CoA N-acyltransferase (NAT) superfamily protein [Quillaja saponaria]|uniref:Acyl-CoA N-acyltransferase (NAT) superfamily protein n=1 Tax=Quillaja saponaria TaxID=32244 RepID=A0AAD7QCY1_QUISA|nr:Acyl-CoA N-acyltransferase (NAT) superfamily protein [Quillaja saponaria]
MSTISIHRPQFPSFSFNGYPNYCKFQRKALSCNMTMDSKFSDTSNKNKEELSVHVSTPPIPQVGMLKTCDLRFDRLQPSDENFGRENKLEFGKFVAREAVLDEEYWTAAWLRAESHWENQPFERYIDNYKRKFADQEFNAIKRRCRGQHGKDYTCIVTVKKEERNVKRTVIKSVVGTLDLSIRFLLQGETFPGERVKAPPFGSINIVSPSRYSYIANLCVAKSARRQGIARNMLYFAVESAKYHGVEQVYVHVDRNNKPAQELYQKMGFKMVEMANSQLFEEGTYLLCLNT